jgi:hypothetical protein
MTDFLLKYKSTPEFAIKRFNGSALRSFLAQKVFRRCAPQNKKENGVLA